MIPDQANGVDVVGSVESMLRRLAFGIREGSKVLGRDVTRWTSKHGGGLGLELLKEVLVVGFGYPWYRPLGENRLANPMGLQ